MDTIGLGEMPWIPENVANTICKHCLQMGDKGVSSRIVLLGYHLKTTAISLIRKSLNKGVHFKSAFQASLFTGLLWELSEHLFGWYVVHLAKYSIFYGSLSTLVIFVLWVYYSSTILVVGAEFAYFLEEDRLRSMV
jgi:YihY family inner membrane protein